MTQEEARQALCQCREQIDEVDLKILDLLNDRMRIVERIGRIKQVVSLPIYEPAREDAVFRNVTEHNSGPLSEEAVRRLFERIIDEARTLQRLRMGK